MSIHTIIDNASAARDSEYRIAGTGGYCLSLSGLVSSGDGELWMFLPQRRWESGICFSISANCDWNVYAFAAKAAEVWRLCISVMARLVKRLVRFRKFWDDGRRRGMVCRFARKQFCLRL